MQEFILSMIPRTVNNIIMWIISFLMLFLLMKKIFRKDLKTIKKQKFLTTENFVILFVFILTIIAFILNVFIIGKQEGIETMTHVLIPATIYSIILSVVAFGTFLAVIFYYLGKKEKKYPPIRNYLFSILIFILFLGMRKINKVLLVPYGTLVTSVINLIIEICVFGFLEAYIFASIILYLINTIKAK